MKSPLPVFCAPGFPGFAIRTFMPASETVNGRVPPWPWRGQRAA
jgi:hypothetical protein